MTLSSRNDMKDKVSTDVSVLANDLSKSKPRAEGVAGSNLILSPAVILSRRQRISILGMMDANLSMLSQEKKNSLKIL